MFGARPQSDHIVRFRGVCRRYAPSFGGEGVAGGFWKFWKGVSRVRRCFQTSLWAAAFILISVSAASGQTAAQTASNPLPSLRVSEARNDAFRNNWDLLASKSDVDLA